MLFKFNDFNDTVVNIDSINYIQKNSYNGEERLFIYFKSREVLEIRQADFDDNYDGCLNDAVQDLICSTPKINLGFNERIVCKH